MSQKEPNNLLRYTFAMIAGNALIPVTAAVALSSAPVAVPLATGAAGLAAFGYCIKKLFE